MPKTILVIDNNVEAREALAEHLEKEGYIVHTASHGREALKQLEPPNNPPDLVLLDRAFPGDGLDFISSLKEKGVLWDVPVIVTRAAALTEEVPDLKVVLVRPFDFASLLRVVKRHLG